MDKELRLQLLRACVRDVSFLKATHSDIDPEIFPEDEERLVATAALTFYTNYTEPIGAFLRTKVQELVEKEKLGSERKTKLKELLTAIQSGTRDLVSVKALKDQVKLLKKNAFYEKAVDKVCRAYEKGELSPEVLSQLVDQASKELSTNGHIAKDYLEELENRIARREYNRKRKYPLLLIDPLDEKIDAIGRGHVGLYLAPYASGKGMALVHTTMSYALQGLNVLHFTLEDPVDEVEDRLDANIAGVALKRLVAFPKKIRKQFQIKKEQVRGKIKIIDATEGGWTISKIDHVWEYEANAGFIADAVVVDYDDELESEEKFKGDNAKRMIFDSVYKRFRQFAAKRNVIGWTAAQGTRASENKKYVTGRDAAEDISKIRKVFLAIGIGRDPDISDKKYLYVCRHRLDRSRFAVSIMSNYAGGVFYDREETIEMQKIEAEKVKD